jgi:hypothetical protein
LYVEEGRSWTKKGSVFQALKLSGAFLFLVSGIFGAFQLMPRSG